MTYNSDELNKATRKQIEEWLQQEATKRKDFGALKGVLYAIQYAHQSGRLSWQTEFYLRDLKPVEYWQLVHQLADDDNLKTIADTVRFLQSLGFNRDKDGNAIHLGHIYRIDDVDYHIVALYDEGGAKAARISDREPVVLTIGDLNKAQLVGERKQSLQSFLARPVDEKPDFDEDCWVYDNLNDESFRIEDIWEREEDGWLLQDSDGQDHYASDCVFDYRFPRHPEFTQVQTAAGVYPSLGDSLTANDDDSYTIRYKLRDWDGLEDKAEREVTIERCLNRLENSDLVLDPNGTGIAICWGKDWLQFTLEIVTLSHVEEGLCYYDLSSGFNYKVLDVEDTGANVINLSTWETERFSWARLQDFRLDYCLPNRPELVEIAVRTGLKTDFGDTITDNGDGSVTVTFVTLVFLKKARDHWTNYYLSRLANRGVIISPNENSLVVNWSKNFLSITFDLPSSDQYLQYELQHMRICYALGTMDLTQMTDYYMRVTGKPEPYALLEAMKIVAEFHQALRD